MQMLSMASMKSALYGWCLKLENAEIRWFLLPKWRLAELVRVSQMEIGRNDL